jgi:hypothetical protein
LKINLSHWILETLCYSFETQGNLKTNNYLPMLDVYVDNINTTFFKETEFKNVGSSEYIEQSAAFNLSFLSRNIGKLEFQGFRLTQQP